MGLLNWLRTWRRHTITARYPSPADIPDQLRSRNVAVTGTPEHPKWLVFECPCQRGHRVMLNLDPSIRPAWRIDGDLHTPLSITPSIDEHSASGHCHYWIARGRVRWAERKDTRR